jgi:hypothetical protein
MALAALFSLVPYLPCLPAQPRTGERTERRSGPEWSVRRNAVRSFIKLQKSIPAKALNSGVWGGSPNLVTPKRQPVYTSLSISSNYALHLSRPRVIYPP